MFYQLKRGLFYSESLFLCICLVFLFIHIENVKADESDTPKFPRKPNISIYAKVVEYLKEDYNPLAFPICKGNSSMGLSQQSKKPFQVSIDLYVYRLFALDSPTQMLTLDTWIELNWKDCGLTWDPKEFSNVKEVTLPAEHIWFPEIISYQSLHGNYEEGLYIFKISRAKIRYDGSVMLGGQTLLRTFCKLNIRAYPFDTQTCNITFASWSKDASEFHLTRKVGSVHDNEGHTLSEVSNGEWAVLGIETVNTKTEYDNDMMKMVSSENRTSTTVSKRGVTEVTFRLILQRKPTFVQIYLLFPCVILFWLALVTFILPLECGEKISLCMTILLSQIVLLLVLADSIPRTATDLPTLGYFYLLSIILVLFCVLFTAIVVNVGNKQANIIMPKGLAQFIGREDIRRTCFRLSANSRDENLTGWRLFACLLDRIFFVLYFLLAVALTSFIYSY